MSPAFAHTSAAVLTFFAKDRRHHSVWRVRVAPALGLVGLVAFLGLILVNLKDLVGGSSGLALAVILVLVVGFVGGAVLGYRRARTESLTPAGEEG